MGTIADQMPRAWLNQNVGWVAEGPQRNSYDHVVDDGRRRLEREGNGCRLETGTVASSGSCPDALFAGRPEA